MKQKALLILAVVGMLTAMASCDDKPVVPAELPASVQQFVQQYFPDQTISYAKKDLDWFTYTYQVFLVDGTEVSFDTDNQWDKVDTRTNPVPQAIVPAPIATYVNTSLPNVAIVSIDKESHGYDVDLANGLELKFNKQGALMELDD